MKKDQDAHPHPLQRKTLNESIPGFWVIDGCNGHGSAHGIIQDCLVFHKICATWVPEQFTGKHNI
jgi:hypothetical protein